MNDRCGGRTHDLSRFTPTHWGPKSLNDTAECKGNVITTRLIDLSLKTNKDWRICSKISFSHAHDRSVRCLHQEGPQAQRRTEKTYRMLLYVKFMTYGLGRNFPSSQSVPYHKAVRSTTTSTRHRLRSKWHGHLDGTDLYRGSTLDLPRRWDEISNIHFCEKAAGLHVPSSYTYGRYATRQIGPEKREYWCVCLRERLTHSLP